MISAFRQAGILSEKNAHAFSCFLRAIIYKKTGAQLMESEPRVIKRRPKPLQIIEKNQYGLS